MKLRNMLLAGVAAFAVAMLTSSCSTDSPPPPPHPAQHKNFDKDGKPCLCDCKECLNCEKKCRGPEGTEKGKHHAPPPPPLRKDGDGKVSCPEKPDMKKAMEEKKKAFDKDGDGKLSDSEKAEFDKAMKAELEEHMLKRFDKDGDGKLSDAEKAEIEKFMKEMREKRPRHKDVDPEEKQQD